MQRGCKYDQMTMRKFQTCVFNSFRVVAFIYTPEETIETIDISRDSGDAVLIDYLERGSTIIGAYYAPLRDQLKCAIQVKRPYLVKKEVLFHHLNPPVYMYHVVAAKLHELRF
ncbi:hypothetical protein AMK59_4582 [Oryctes borbonicus]|uniref:Uncharacterized protein n=1 Tax=Oryctes borbonicus TaxID=1629725 RepID=A0A0T6B8G8_9SCAR|nr:hypothetical protein AMK59_4582 [Oryctes borbonicus]